MTTREAAKAVSKALGCDLSLRDVDGLTRAWPQSTLPPLGANGRRRWELEHVERLKAQVEARQAKTGAA